jgi:hypothetical protein
MKDSASAPKRKNRWVTGVILGVIFLLTLTFLLSFSPLKDVFLLRMKNPQVTITVIRGPEAETDGRFLFEVEATIHGNPVPVLMFSRDDSHGKAGENRTWIIMNAGENYTVIATASSSRGKDFASLELVAPLYFLPEPEPDPEPEPVPAHPSAPTLPVNQPPVLGSIECSADIIYAGSSYEFTVAAMDQDGDRLKFKWTATGGSITNVNGNLITWKAPDTTGSFTLNVTVNDGRGGVAAVSKEFLVDRQAVLPKPNPLTPTQVPNPLSTFKGPLISPSGGEIWAVGSKHSILWDESELGWGEVLTILYSTDSGVTWNQIYKGTDPGYYEWTIPDTPTTKARVRVKLTFPYSDYLQTREYIFTSAEDFTILGNLNWIIIPINP